MDMTGFDFTLLSCGIVLIEIQSRRHTRMYAVVASGFNCGVRIPITVSFSVLGISFILKS